MAKKEWYDSMGQVYLTIDLDDAKEMSMPGRDAYETVKALLPEYQKQLSEYDDYVLASILSEYGAWDEKQLADRTENEIRILWIASCDIMVDDDNLYAEVD